MVQTFALYTKNSPRFTPNFEVHPFIIPVEAKVGNDKVGVVQLMQDMSYCEQNFPDLICVPIAVHRMDDETLCMFRLTLDKGEAKIVDEKHYKLATGESLDRAKVAKRNRDLTGI